MALHSYRYQRPFVMKDDGADGHWIEDAAGVPLDRSQILEVLNGSLGPSLPELKESLDFNRLYSGDHRALYPDHQAHFDAHYDALKAAEFVTWMEGHAPHTLKNLLKMYKRTDATGSETTKE